MAWPVDFESFKLNGDEDTLHLKMTFDLQLIQNGNNTQELHEMMDSTAAELYRTSEVLTDSEGVGVMRATLSEDHREEDYSSRSIRLICLSGAPNRNELHWESPMHTFRFIRAPEKSTRR